MTKRILHVVGVMDRAGAETMVMNLYRAIDRNQYQFDFVYFTEKECAFDAEILQLGGVIYRISNDKSKSLLLRTFELYKIIKINSFHAVHCHQLFSNAFHLCAAFFAGSKKRIAHSHNTSDSNSTSFFGRLYQSFAKLLIALLATDFIACGKQAGVFLFPNRKNITLIPNAVDIAKFMHQPKEINFFKNSSISEKTLVISQVGRFMPVKNHEFSLDLAVCLKNKGVDFHLFFAGSGPLEETLKNSAFTKEVSDKITFLGVRSDIENVLAHSSVLLMPSFHEGFPVILVESQVAGIPALISDSISKEVDLGLNLVHFKSLKSDSVSNWCSELEKIKEVFIPPPEERLAVLREKGFDIEVSVTLLEQIYQ